jgi:hypothetical protein
MEIQNILGIACIALVLGVIIYKRVTRGETLKDIYEDIDNQEIEEQEKLK